MLVRMDGSGNWSFKRFEHPKASIMESSSSFELSKRAKAPRFNTVSCLVDGCNSDLSRCKEYHRRHKVCEIHSKTPKVTIGGCEQRFCQQCSRFHSLVEFDEGKRSCRKRLDGHNRRRRKPHLDSLSRNTAHLLSNEQGTTLLSFSSSQLLPNAITNPPWAGPEPVKAENAANAQQSFTHIGSHHYLPGPISHSFGLPLLDEPPPVVQPLLSADSSPADSLKMFPDGLNRVIGDSSDCALSLLSPGPATTREIGRSPVVSAQSLAQNWQYGELSQYSQGVEDKAEISFMSSYANLHCQGMMFQSGTDGSSASGPNQTLSFSWG